ncbi:MAG: hypothetical protein AUF74_01655 [Thaumarchaeota archaeon 13_1_20CM_2_38_5]|nr:MAG: hypothetical protein AUF74_01655 [Thaumarchaeota archaeon 13_1_20CM_2_38_5]
MEIKKIPDLLSISNFPVGLGGCRNEGRQFDCCEHNITVMDEKSGETVHKISNHLVKLHHCSSLETNAGVLMQLENMTILCDDQWKLRMLLSKIKEKAGKIFTSYTQNCLIDTGIFANKAREAVKNKDPLAGVWVKCASYFLTDALFSINFKRPSPAHMLEMMRDMKKDNVNQNFLLIHQILGIERTSTSLLSRMVKSTIGFSDMVEGNGHSEIIKMKHDYMVGNSLLADCYFYLGYINRNNILKVKNSLHRKPEYIHVLKVGLDTESDLLTIDKQATSLIQSTNELLVNMKNHK